MVIQVKCGEEMRRQAVKDSANVNGIDYLEIFTTRISLSKFQQLLLVYCFKTEGLSEIRKDNVLIDGGVRKKGITAEWVQQAETIVNDLTSDIINEVTEDLTEEEKNIIKNLQSSVQKDTLVIRLSGYGDYSTYTLSLVRSLQSELPPGKFDVILSKIQFSFKAACLADFDCAPNKACASLKNINVPIIDYQAKDFASFRRLILDHISTIMPQLKERNPASLEIVVIELLAYVFDHLSYYQDAVATESYLGTARKRISIRRHARFLDYFLHDGCNARAWICIEMSSDVNDFVIKQHTKLLTRGANVGSSSPILPSTKFEEAIASGDEAFETMHDVTIYSSHNEISFYTWGDSQCCLPEGAISATVRNDGNKFDDLFLFTWNNLVSSPPEYTDLENLKKFLREEIGIGWLVPDNSEIKPNLISENVLLLSDETDFLYLILNDIKSQVTASNDKEGISKIYEFVARTDGDKLNVYALSLKAGDVLLFEETASPTTFRQEDVNSAHRHFVRLSGVTRGFDELFGVPLLEISWKPQDALPFPLCLEVVHSNLDDKEDVIKSRKTISVARGNIVLADHGYSLTKSMDSALIESQGLLHDKDDDTYDDNQDVPLTDTYEYSDLFKVEATEFLGFAPPTSNGKRKFRPRLSRRPLTFMGPFDDSLPASAALHYDVRKARPDILLNGEGRVWLPLRDLLQSREFDDNFVVEIENDGTAIIRFGYFENTEGASSKTEYSITSGYPFFATYRVGNGTRGNVGAESITRIVLDGVDNSLFTSCRNAMAAVGGTEPEDIELVRHYAPEAFRSQERAVTTDDYVEILRRHPEIQGAFATIRWTGSWYTVFVAIDRIGGKAVDIEFKKNILDYLNRYRLAGYDLEIREPIYVPLYVQINLCIHPNYFPSNVKKQLLEVFSNDYNIDGSKGFFHPDNITFGQPVLLSKIYEAAMSVDGVCSCNVEYFQRFGKMANGEIEKGAIEMGYYELARLDNDPNFPENGKIEFTFAGIDIPIEEIVPRRSS